MEVIVATVILSVVMVALLQVKSDNIFLIKKSTDSKKLYDYANMAIDTDIKEVDNRNTNKYLKDIYSFKNDEIRRKFDDIKVKIKDKKLDIKKISQNNTSFKIITYSTSYSIDKKIKKNIYTFKIEL